MPGALGPMPGGSRKTSGGGGGGRRGRGMAVQSPVGGELLAWH